MTSTSSREKIWFRSKNYGYGWYPSTWQGWTVMLCYVLILIALSLNENNFNSSKGVLMYVCGKVLPLTLLLIIICYVTGEKAEWRWGKKE